MGVSTASGGGVSKEVVFDFWRTTEFFMQYMEFRGISRHFDFKFRGPQNFVDLVAGEGRYNKIRRQQKGLVLFQHIFLKGDFFDFFHYCLICRPSDSTGSEDTGIFKKSLLSVTLFTPTPSLSFGYETNKMIS